VIDCNIESDKEFPTVVLS